MKSIGSTFLKTAAIVVCLGIFVSACYVRGGGYVRTDDRRGYVHGDDHREYQWSHR
jgi:hypothetical protein